MAHRLQLVHLAIGSLLTIASLGSSQAQDIPKEFLEDQHFLEEFGVNKMTTPSIRKIFQEVERLGDINFPKIKRDTPDKTPRDRTQVAISLGGLISDGFFIVHSGELDGLEDVGRAVMKHASAMGAGAKITGHARSLIEHATKGNKDKLMEELVATQADVQIEMIGLRDEDAVHLIGFGGWLRAIQVAAKISSDPYDPNKTQVLKRVDIADYYVTEFKTLHPRVLEKDFMIVIQAELVKLRDLLEVPIEEIIDQEKLAQIQAKVDDLAKVAFQ